LKGMSRSMRSSRTPGGGCRDRAVVKGHDRRLLQSRLGVHPRLPTEAVEARHRVGGGAVMNGDRDTMLSLVDDLTNEITAARAIEAAISGLQHRDDDTRRGVAGFQYDHVNRLSRGALLFMVTLARPTAGPFICGSLTASLTWSLIARRAHAQAGRPGVDVPSAPGRPETGPA
jgi:hypothetical protein